MRNRQESCLCLANAASGCYFALAQPLWLCKVRQICDQARAARHAGVGSSTNVAMHLEQRTRRLLVGGVSIPCHLGTAWTRCQEQSAARGEQVSICMQPCIVIEQRDQQCTCVSDHALDVVGHQHCPELPRGGPICPGRHSLVDAHHTHPVTPCLSNFAFELL